MTQVAAGSVAGSTAVGCAPGLFVVEALAVLLDPAKGLLLGGPVGCFCYREGSLSPAYPRLLLSTLVVTGEVVLMASPGHVMVRQDPAGRVGRTARYVGAAVSCVVALLYGGFFVIVRDAELAVVGGTDDTFPAYAALAVVYLVGAVLLVLLERRWVWVTGAIVQVVVLGLFVVFGVGVFAHAALRDVPVALWVAAISGLQVVLLGVLTYLAASHRNVPTVERPPG